MFCLTVVLSVVGRSQAGILIVGWVVGMLECGKVNASHRMEWGKVIERNRNRLRNNNNKRGKIIMLDVTRENLKHFQW